MALRGVHAVKGDFEHQCALDLAHRSEAIGGVVADPLVEPGLVLEVAFDAVQRSKRHKSGLAMRFPRIHRIRWDKPAAEADRLESLEKLVEE